MKKIRPRIVDVSIMMLVYLFLLTIFVGLDVNFWTYTLFISFLLHKILCVPSQDTILKDIKNNWLELVVFICFLFSPPWFVVGLVLLCIKHIISHYIIDNNSAFESMMILGLCLLSFATISIRQFEILPECNIKNGFDAIWWSICTITTVGYGDKFPITDGGKVIALMFMISGIGLFGTLIGYVSTFFTDREKNNNDKIDTIEELSSQLAELKELIKKQN